MTMFIISDTHFGHAKFLTFQSEHGHAIRKFSSVEEMDETMVDNWNRVVTDSDTVYHLGDVYFGDGHKHLDRLKGKKRLVVGNHDNLKCQHLHKTFKKIMLWRLFKEHDCLLTHVPMNPDQMHKASINLHGHIHEKLMSDSSMYVNCCVEHNNYTPVPLEELVKRAKKE